MDCGEREEGKSWWRENQVRRGAGASRVTAETASQQDRGRTGEWGRVEEVNVRAARKERAALGHGGLEQWTRY
jgi:hypothetical protein